MGLTLSRYLHLKLCETDELRKAGRAAAAASRSRGAHVTGVSAADWHDAPPVGSNSPLSNAQITRHSPSGATDLSPSSATNPSSDPSDIRRTLQALKKKKAVAAANGGGGGNRVGTNSGLRVGENQPNLEGGESGRGTPNGQRTRKVTREDDANQTAAGTMGGDAGGGGMHLTDYNENSLDPTQFTSTNESAVQHPIPSPLQLPQAHPDASAHDSAQRGAKGRKSSAGLVTGNSTIVRAPQQQPDAVSPLLQQLDEIQQQQPLGAESNAVTYHLAKSTAPPRVAAHMHMHPAEALASTVAAAAASSNHAAGTSTAAAAASPSPAAAAGAKVDHSRFAARKPSQATPLIIAHDNAALTYDNPNGTGHFRIISEDQRAAEYMILGRGGAAGGGGGASGGEQKETMDGAQSPSDVAKDAALAAAALIPSTNINDGYYSAGEERETLEKPFLAALAAAAAAQAAAPNPVTSPSGSSKETGTTTPKTPKSGRGGAGGIIKWKKGELLGFGAFGHVYLGLNLENGQLMAVKQVPLYRKDASRSSRMTDLAVMALEQEIEMMKTLPKHENIVAYLGTLRERESSRTPSKSKAHTPKGHTPTATTPKHGAGGKEHGRHKSLESDSDLSHAAEHSHAGGMINADDADAAEAAANAAAASAHGAHGDALPPGGGPRSSSSSEKRTSSATPGSSHSSSNSPKMFNIFLEYVPGGSIASLLKKFGKFNEGLVRIYIKQILQGLRFLHQHGILHRDVKGGNILVDNKSVCKLADFGAAARMQDLGDGSKNLQGTPYWMAPEVVKQCGHGRQADVWSLGCTVIEMVSGKPPWHQFPTHVSAMLHIATTQEYPDIPAELSDEAKHFTQACLNRDPKKRPNADRLLTHPFVTGKKLIDVAWAARGPQPSHVVFVRPADYGPVVPQAQRSSKRVSVAKESRAPPAAAAAVAQLMAPETATQAHTVPATPIDVNVINPFAQPTAVLTPAPHTSTAPPAVVRRDEEEFEFHEGQPLTNSPPPAPLTASVEHSPQQSGGQQSGGSSGGTVQGGGGYNPRQGASGIVRNNPKNAAEGDVVFAHAIQQQQLFGEYARKGGNPPGAAASASAAGGAPISSDHNLYSQSQSISAAPVSSSGGSMSPDAIAAVQAHGSVAGGGLDGPAGAPTEPLVEIFQVNHDSLADSFIAAKENEPLRALRLAAEQAHAEQTLEDLEQMQQTSPENAVAATTTVDEEAVQDFLTDQLHDAVLAQYTEDPDFIRPLSAVVSRPGTRPGTAVARTGRREPLVIPKDEEQYHQIVQLPEENSPLPSPLPSPTAPAPLATAAPVLLPPHPNPRHARGNSNGGSPSTQPASSLHGHSNSHGGGGGGGGGGGVLGFQSTPNSNGGSNTSATGTKKTVLAVQYPGGGGSPSHSPAGATTAAGSSGPYSSNAAFGGSGGGMVSGIVNGTAAPSGSPKPQHSALVRINNHRMLARGGALSPGSPGLTHTTHQTYNYPALPYPLPQHQQQQPPVASNMPAHHSPQHSPTQTHAQLLQQSTANNIAAAKSSPVFRGFSQQSQSQAAGEGHETPVQRDTITVRRPGVAASSSSSVSQVSDSKQSHHSTQQQQQQQPVKLSRAARDAEREAQWESDLRAELEYQQTQNAFLMSGVVAPPPAAAAAAATLHPPADPTQPRRSRHSSSLSQQALSNLAPRVRNKAAQHR